MGHLEAECVFVGRGGACPGSLPADAQQCGLVSKLDKLDLQKEKELSTHTPVKPGRLEP